MFNQYSKPKYFYQHLHNALVNFFVKTGQYIGFLWLEPSPDGQKFTFCSKPLLVWSIIVTSIQIPFLFYWPYYLNFIKPNDLGSNELSSVLVGLSDVIFSAALIFFYVKVAFRQTSIMNLINYISKLQNLFSQYCHQWKCEKSEKCGKVLLYHMIVKVVLNCSIIIPVTILNVLACVTNPILSNIICGLLQPVAFIVYCFITTMYYIPFAFGLFLMQKLSENLSHQKLHIISSFYQDILKYLRKVNSFMETVIFLLLFTAFVALVGEVSA